MEVIMSRLVMCIAVVGLAATTAPADAPEGKPSVDLTLTKATAQRFDGGGVIVICEVVLDNRTGKELKVRSNFYSAFDGLTLYVRDEKGKLLLRRGYIWHQSPFSPPGREFPLKPGENTGELRFPIDLPADVKAIRVSLAGTLPGSGYDEILVTDVVPVNVAPAK
jgi:hypothetical protein